MPKWLLASAAIAFAPIPSNATETGAADGAAVFFNLCGGTVVGTEWPTDVPDVEFTKLSPGILKKVRPTEDGPFWDVLAKHSDFRGLLHIWSNGNCSLEILKSDEKTTRAAFGKALAGFADAAGGVLEQRPDKVEMKERLPMTSSEWIVTTVEAQYLVGLITYPEDRFMTQHIMMLRRVR